MKGNYYQALKTFLADHMRETRKELKLTQAQMAEKLELDIRSYSNVENAKSLCSTITLLHYLLHVCTDVPALLDELKSLMDSMKKEPESEKEKKI